jgi:orotate phosphoribosyltransferase
MQSEELLNKMRASSALLEGHFILTSGLHSDRYFQCARLLANTVYAAETGAALAALLPEKLDLVLSPALGGIIIGHEVARARRLPFYFSERDGGVMVLRRGFEIPAGARVAVVEDVVTSGGSLLEAARLAREAGAQVMAAAAIVDRTSGRSIDFGAPFVSLLKVEVTTWGPGDCPLCRAGQPAVKPGSRHLGGKSGA